MRIGIFGAGAIGSYLGARLAAGGADPVIVARGGQLAAIRARGLSVVGDEALTANPRTAASAAEAGACDLVISCVKAHGLTAAAPEIARMQGERGAWACVVNGIPWWYGRGAGGPLAGVRLETVDPGGAIASAVGRRPVIGAVAYLRCAVTEPGVVEFTGGPGLVLGSPEGRPDPTIAEAGRIINAAGVPARVADDIRAAVWHKLYGNVALNPASAVSGLTVEQMLADPEQRAVLRAVGLEAMQVATAVGCPPGDDIEARLKTMAQLGAFRTSMLQDADAGRPLELAAIIDAVVEIAARVGVAVPATGRLAAEADSFAKARGLRA